MSATLALTLLDSRDSELALDLAPDLSEVQRADSAVSAFCRNCEIPHDAATSVLISLEEILLNIIQYSGARTISLRARATGQRLEVQVEDDGAGFNPLLQPQPSMTAAIDDRSVGGLGIHLVRRLMTSVEYHWRDGRNCLSMARRLAPAPQLDDTVR